MGGGAEKCVGHKELARERRTGAAPMVATPSLAHLWNVLYVI